MRYLTKSPKGESTCITHSQRIGAPNYELEIGEILLLFKRWSRRSTLEERFLVELIRHFYPETIIEDTKYILGVRCLLWDERQELMDSLEVFYLVFFVTRP